MRGPQPSDGCWDSNGHWDSPESRRTPGASTAPPASTKWYQALSCVISRTSPRCGTAGTARSGSEKHSSTRSSRRTCPAQVPRPSGSRRRAALPVPEVFSGSAVETPVRVASPARPVGVNGARTWVERPTPSRRRASRRSPLRARGRTTRRRRGKSSTCERGRGPPRDRPPGNALGHVHAAVALPPPMTRKARSSRSPIPRLAAAVRPARVRVGQPSCRDTS